MESILERYERYSYAERRLIAGSAEIDHQEDWPLEYSKLKAKIELLQRNHRHYMGEELDSMSLKELQSLEQQLDTALKHIRSRKSQLMYESISELQKKEKAIQEQNNQLSKKIKEKEKIMSTQQAQWEQQNSVPNSTSFLYQQPLPPCMNLSVTIEEHRADEEAAMRRRNELDLTLDSLFPCHLGCFAA